MKYLLIGIQGAGKSTQGNLLSKSLHLPYLSTGHIFRVLSHEKTQRGRRIKELINVGWLIPDKEVLEIVTDYLHRPEYKKGYILDGFPRTLHQAKAFENGIDKAFYLKVSDKEALWRLSYRDDHEREDETLIALRKRIELFHKFTEPVLDFYRENHDLIEIDGEKSIEDIHQEIMRNIVKDNPEAGKEPITFVTGNKTKAEQLSLHLPFSLAHKAVDLPEIQSLDLTEIVREKAKEAYDKVHGPVLVEDTSLTFLALKQLPGPLIKWFLMELGNEGLCRLLDHHRSRAAVAEVMFAFYDGATYKTFSGEMKGSIALHPRGKDGLGWDSIFIPEGYKKTWGEMTKEEQIETSMRRRALVKFAKYLDAKE